jgi:hypothetical protein
MAFRYSCVRLPCTPIRAEESILSTFQVGVMPHRAQARYQCVSFDSWTPASVGIVCVD